MLIFVCSATFISETKSMEQTLLEILTISQLVKKYPVFNAASRFIVIFITVRHFRNYPTNLISFGTGFYTKSWQVKFLSFRAGPNENAVSH
jgi:hypothetical protein